MTDETLGPLAYPPETILTESEVARWLRCSERTVRDMNLPKIKLPGSRMVRYNAGQLLRFFTAQETAA